MITTEIDYAQFSISPRSRVLLDTTVQTGIEATKQALMFWEKFTLDNADLLDPQGHARQLEASIAGQTDPAKIRETLREAGRLTSPAAITAAMNLQSKAQRLNEAGRHILIHTLNNAATLLAQWQAEAESTEDAFMAQFSLPGERSQLSKRYASEVAKVKALVANLIQPVSSGQGTLPVEALRWLGVEDIAE
jgi:hypothetical protein